MGKNSAAELELELERQLARPPQEIGTVIAASGFSAVVTAEQRCTSTPRPIGMIDPIVEVSNFIGSGQIITVHAFWDVACAVPLATVLPGQTRRFDRAPWRFLGLTRYAARMNVGLPILGRRRF